MNIKRFMQFINEQFINEGGNAIKTARGIRQDEVPPTLKDLDERFFKKLLNMDSDEWCVLGSAGKKAKPEDLSGDIDVGVFIGKLAAMFECELDVKVIINHFEELLHKHFGSYEIFPSKGLGIISIGWPIQSKDGGVVQVDFMLSDNIEWTKFAWHSPDIGKLESKYKGAYRNALLEAIVNANVYEVIKQQEDTDKLKKGDVIAIDKASYDFIRGLTRTVKNFVGKKGGLIKTPTTVSRTLETNIPEEFIKKVLGITFSVKNANSFEDLLDVVNDKKFIHYDKREKIILETIKILEGKELPLPEELLKYK